SACRPPSAASRLSCRLSGSGRAGPRPSARPCPRRRTESASLLRGLLAVRLARPEESDLPLLVGRRARRQDLARVGADALDARADQLLDDLDAAVLDTGPHDLGRPRDAAARLL